MALLQVWDELDIHSAGGRANPIRAEKVWAQFRSPIEVMCSQAALLGWQMINTVRLPSEMLHESQRHS